MHKNALLHRSAPIALAALVLVGPLQLAAIGPIPRQDIYTQKRWAPRQAGEEAGSAVPCRDLAYGGAEHPGMRVAPENKRRPGCSFCANPAEATLPHGFEGWVDAFWRGYRAVPCAGCKARRVGRQPSWQPLGQVQAQPDDYRHAHGGTCGRK